jgi:transposase
MTHATEFSIALELACSVNLFHEGDVLVLDNKVIHFGGDNAVFEEWMRDQFGVLVLFLPPRSPELNPIELMWNTTSKAKNCFSQRTV